MAIAVHDRDHQDKKDMEQLASDLAVLAEPHRLQVLGELRTGPRSAGSLAKATGMAPSLASHHLAVLLRADLVSRWREGSFVYYTLNQDRAGEIQQTLGALTRPAPDGSGRRPEAGPHEDGEDGGDGDGGERVTGDLADEERTPGSG